MMTKQSCRGILWGMKFFGKVDDIMNPAMKKMIPLWALGLALFVLRFVELRTGFDAATGLTLPTVARPALIGGTVLAALYAVAAVGKRSAERPSFEEQFAAPGRWKIIPVLGSFLHIGGGLWLGIQSMTEELVITQMITAALAMVSGCGFLVLVKRMGDDEADSVAPLLPGLLFSAFWVLSLYLPSGNDPVLARYWLPILAAAMQAYALAQISGFFRRETSPRSFRFMARISVMLCIAAAAGPNMTLVPLFLGSALVTSTFLVLERD